MKLSSNKTRSASGSKWKKKKRRGKRERERETAWQERQYKMPINFYCFVMKVRWMRREGTREGAVTVLSLYNYRSHPLKTCNLKIKAPLQTRAAWLMTKRTQCIFACVARTSYTLVNIYEARIYLWIERGPPTDTETPWSICESLCVHRHLKLFEHDSLTSGFLSACRRNYSNMHIQIQYTWLLLCDGPLDHDWAHNKVTE